MITRRSFLKGALASSAVAAGLGLVGCGGGSGGSGGSGSGSSAKVEITVPSYKTGENVGAVFFVPQIERFNKKYEGQYKINLETVAQDDFNDRIKQLSQQKKLPVLVQGGDKDWRRDIAFPSGLALDLSSWLDEHKGIKDILIPDGLDYCTNDDGTIYNMPDFAVRPNGFFWNSALWDTTDDFNTMSMDDFIAAFGDQKMAFQSDENAWTTALTLTALIANENGGAEWLRAGMDDQISDFSDPAFLAAVTKLQTLLQKNAAPNSIGAAYADAANNFMSGQATMIANGPWMAADFKEDNSGNWSNGFNGADVRAALWPGDVGIATTRQYGEWWISAAASKEEQELALAFLEFTCEKDEIEAYLLAEGGDAPAITYSDNFKQELAKTQVLADLSADTSEQTVYVPNVLDVMPQSVANTEFGKLIPSLADGSYTPEEFVQWMTDKSAEATSE